MVSFVPTRRSGFAFRIALLLMLAGASLAGLDLFQRLLSFAAANEIRKPDNAEQTAGNARATVDQRADAVGPKELAAAPGVQAVASKSDASLPAPAALLPAAGKPEATKPTRAREISPSGGIVFEGEATQVEQANAGMQQWLGQLGWTERHVQTHLSADGKRVAYSLNSSPGETDTLSLAKQPQWGLAPDTITYQDRRGQTRTLPLVSQKEILAAMLQHGREFHFAGADCSIARLQQEVAVRQNIVYWGSRADWVFPEDKIYRYNTADYWEEMQGDDWTLKPRVRPAQAIADAFVGKFSYQIGCTSACRFIVAHGIFDYFQRVRADAAQTARLEQMLDSRRPFLNMAPTVDPDGTHRIEGLLVERQFNVPSDHWAPGDWGWIKNTDALSAEELGSEGCNIIYAGGGMFVNYYPERPPKTLDESIKRVYGWRFGIDEGDLRLSDDVAKTLRRDPRHGGLLRDVRDIPRRFGPAPEAQPGA